MIDTKGVTVAQVVAALAATFGSAQGLGSHSETGAGGPGEPASRQLGPAQLAKELHRVVVAAELAAGGVQDAVCVLPKGTNPPNDVVAGLLVATDQPELQPGNSSPVVLVPEARLALAVISALFAGRRSPATGVSGSAVIAADAVIGRDVYVGPGATIGQGAELGDGCSVGAGSHVGSGCRLGSNCVLYENVTLYANVRLGDRVRVHAGSVIGADGFGYAASPRGAVKIHHLGGVRIGDDVEIGANSCIDRGTLNDTVVGARSKIDNLCQLGHNVQVGSDTLIAGQTGIAGSATIGSRVIIGGAVAISDHVVIGDGARIAGRSGVTKDVPAGATWAGFPAKPHREFARDLYLLSKLETVWNAVKKKPKAQ